MGFDAIWGLNCTISNIPDTPRQWLGPYLTTSSAGAGAKKCPQNLGLWPGFRGGAGWGLRQHCRVQGQSCRLRVERGPPRGKTHEHKKDPGAGEQERGNHVKRKQVCVYNQGQTCPNFTYYSVPRSLGFNIQNIITDIVARH